LRGHKCLKQRANAVFAFLN
jgi:hypothetical protein